MIELTVEQQDAMLKLGNTKSDIEFMSIEMVNQLMSLGLVHKRASDGHLDFTDLGETVYDGLSNK